MKPGFARRSVGLIAAVLIIAPVLAGISVSPAAAAGTVGDGTLESCTEAALRDAIDGGGLVTFNCPDNTTIPIADEIEITEDTEIQGNGDIEGGVEGGIIDFADADPAIIGTNSRVFRVASGVTLKINGLGIGGNSDGSGGAILNESGSLELSNMIIGDSSAVDEGGGISSVGGPVTISNSVFIDNESESSGGAISIMDGPLTLTNTFFIGNSAEGFGGAVASFGFFNLAGTTVDIEKSVFGLSQAIQGGAINLLGTSSTTIADSLFIENDAMSTGPISGDGGAINVGSGNLNIMRTSIIDNASSGFGGAISRYGSGDVTITQSTISSNVANGSSLGANVGGGGVYNNFEQSSGGSMTIINSTIVDNDAPNAFGDGIGARAETNITNSIVANNGDQNCAIDETIGGSINSGGHNLSSDDSCPFGEGTDLTETDPMLGEIEFVGTDDFGYAAHFPQEGSPAIGGGPEVCESPDQRGVSRPQGVRCDIGAIEIEMPADLCLNRYNGDLRSSRTGSCASTEIPHYFVEQGSLDVCVNRYNGDARFSRTGACASTETPQTIEGDGSFNVCINRYNGDVRVPRVEGQCASTETSREF